MNINFAFSGQVLLVSLIIFSMLIVTFIVLWRRYFRQRHDWHIDHPSDSSGMRISDRIRKYKEMDVFQYSSMFFKVGLALVLALTIVAFNWTSYDQQINIPEDALVLDDEIEIEPPRTDLPPPPPPPPAPPSAIQEVPDEVELEEEIEFTDQSVTEDTRVVYEEPEKTAAPAPPPPPPPEPKEEEIFKIVEEMPRFPGCEDIGGSKEEKKLCADRKLMEYIYRNIEYPQIARENGIEGTVVVQFVVGTDGAIESAKLLKDIGGGCGAEALRIVNEMEGKEGKWIPGQQRGRNVKVYFMLPVKFKLE